MGDLHRLVPRGAAVPAWAVLLLRAGELVWPGANSAARPVVPERSCEPEVRAAGGHAPSREAHGGPAHLAPQRPAL